MSEKIVQLSEEIIKRQLEELVRENIEETLNELLEAKAEELTRMARYEHGEQRQDCRSDHCSHNLTTIPGDVILKISEFKRISFETTVIERYRHRKSSVGEALVEMYLTSISIRRIEDITKILWGSKASLFTISELSKKAYAHIED